MCDRYGVSRTVIREAIAQLRSEGLVTARRGSGLYVTETPMAAQPAFAKIRRESLADTIELLELRSAVEREAAALAAERASPAQKEAIFEAHSAFMEAGAAQTVELDLAFHLAIARGTNNPRFATFLAHLGVDAVPRARLQRETDEPIASAYLDILSTEHKAIADAILAGNPTWAREAMRQHLNGGLARYQALLGRDREA